MHRPLFRSPESTKCAGFPLLPGLPYLCAHWPLPPAGPSGSSLQGNKGQLNGGGGAAPGCIPEASGILRPGISRCPWPKLPAHLPDPVVQFL